MSENIKKSVSSVTPGSPTEAGTEAWKCRSDVLYHFYAYKHFDQGPKTVATIDMINLDDADVEFFNRTAEQTRIFSSEYKLAEYLKKPASFKLPFAAEDTFGVAVDEDVRLDLTNMCVVELKELTMRKQLIWHVRMYNLTQEPRRRFYLLGMTGDDLAFLDTLCGEELVEDDFDPFTDRKPLTAASLAITMVLASDGCAPSGIIAVNLKKDHVALAVEAHLAEFAANNSAGDAKTAIGKKRKIDRIA